MSRSITFEAAVVGTLAALASLCALNASATEPYAVVAQSTRETAATGRRPLSARIASGSLPLQPVPRSDASDSRDAVLNRIRHVLAEERAAAPVAAPASASVDHAPRQAEAAVSMGTPPAARIEFDVRESRAFLTEGDRVIVTIAVRNVGAVPARQVEAALFFADGIEPVNTNGHAAAIASGEVRLEPIETLAPGDTVTLAVTAIGVRPGSVVYRGELECAELPGVLAREGAFKVDPRRVSEADE